MSTNDTDEKGKRSLIKLNINSSTAARLQSAILNYDTISKSAHKNDIQSISKKIDIKNSEKSQNVKEDIKQVTQHPNVNNNSQFMSKLSQAIANTYAKNIEDQKIKEDNAKRDKKIAEEKELLNKKNNESQVNAAPNKVAKPLSPFTKSKWVNNNDKPKSQFQHKKPSHKLQPVENSRVTKTYGDADSDPNIDEFFKEVLVTDEVTISKEDLDADDEKILGKNLNIKSADNDNVYIPRIQRKSQGKKSFRKSYHSGEFVQKTVEIGDYISIKDLGLQTAIKIKELIKICKNHNISVDMKSDIDGDSAQLIAEDIGHRVIRRTAETLADRVESEIRQSQKSQKKIPIVTIMGHVDHGKTSLLDYIRNANVVSKEHGGITQHIGAYHVIDKNNEIITFLDTPGHAAFSAMRARGANITDIVVLVVAVDDGIQPQTIEAIEHIKNSGAAMIVAINKIDKQDINIDKIKQDLLKHDVLLEEFGGDVIYVPLSAKTGQNVDKLLEAISLNAQMLELKCTNSTSVCGFVIESRFDKYHGNVATLIITDGKLSIGSIIATKSAYCKIKVIKDSHGKQLKEIEPGIPFEVSGFNSAPSSGDKFYSAKNEKEAIEFIELNKIDNVSIRAFDDVSAIFVKNNKKCINFILKADTFGSLEAISAMISQIKHDEIDIKIVYKGVGNITDSDFNLAKNTSSICLGFNVVFEGKVKALVEKNEFDGRIYKVIYALIDDIKRILSNALEPIRTEELIGKAEVKKSFDSSSGFVAGVLVLSGEIVRGCICRISKNNSVTSSTVRTLRRFKDDVKEVKQGYECGVQLNINYEFKEGDVLEFYNEKIEKRSVEL